MRYAKPCLTAAIIVALSTYAGWVVVEGRAPASITCPECGQRWHWSEVVTSYVDTDGRSPYVQIGPHRGWDTFCTCELYLGEFHAESPRPIIDLSATHRYLFGQRRSANGERILQLRSAQSP